MQDGNGFLPIETNWFDRFFISVVAFAEVRRGIERMPAGRRRDRLTAWLADELPARFDQRIIGIDRAIAEHWGVITARAQAAGDNMGTMDAFVAAAAAVHGLTLVTRNTKDFAHAGINLLNPWTGND